MRFDGWPVPTLALAREISASLLDDRQRGGPDRLPINQRGAYEARQPVTLVSIQRLRHLVGPLPDVIEQDVGPVDQGEYPYSRTHVLSRSSFG
jgi:hypothetical protein